MHHVTIDDVVTIVVLNMTTMTTGYTYYIMDKSALSSSGSKTCPYPTPWSPSRSQAGLFMPPWMSCACPHTCMNPFPNNFKDAAVTDLRMTGTATWWTSPVDVDDITHRRSWSTPSATPHTRASASCGRSSSPCRGTRRKSSTQIIDANSTLIPVLKISKRHRCSSRPHCKTSTNMQVLGTDGDLLVELLIPNSLASLIFLLTKYSPHKLVTHTYAVI